MATVAESATVAREETLASKNGNGREANQRLALGEDIRRAGQHQVGRHRRLGRDRRRRPSAGVGGAGWASTARGDNSAKASTAHSAEINRMGDSFGCGRSDGHFCESTRRALVVEDRGRLRPLQALDELRARTE